MSIQNALATAKAIQGDVEAIIGPPEEGRSASGQIVIMNALVRGTRDYIERIANQVNGAYENGWYDACAVMLRRLIETLIIEAFEHHHLAQKIKNSQGDFFYLRDLIDRTINEPAWNLGRNTRSALPKLKDVGDKSAHSRRFVAKKHDLDPLLGDIRTVVQELVYLAGLK